MTEVKTKHKTPKYEPQISYFYDSIPNNTKKYVRRVIYRDGIFYYDKPLWQESDDKIEWTDVK